LHNLPKPSSASCDPKASHTVGESVHAPLEISQTQYNPDSKKTPLKPLHVIAAAWSIP
jgi:hypothetical protein